MYLNFRTVGLSETEVCNTWENNFSCRILLFFRPITVISGLAQEICTTAFALGLNLWDSRMYYLQGILKNYWYYLGCVAQYEK